LSGNIEKTFFKNNTSTIKQNALSRHIYNMSTPSKPPRRQGSGQRPHGRRYTPMNDYFFYKIMGEKGDEVQLLGFLNAGAAKAQRSCVDE
jgi:hypothetical protein